MRKTMAVAMLGVTLALSGCGGGNAPAEDPEFDSEGHVACYTAEGKFKKYDDDCEDDGLYTKRNLPKRTTPSPAKPVVKRSPFRR